MRFNVENVRNYLRNFDFKKLFIEELGWDNYDNSLNIQIEESTYQLNAIAEKSGVDPLSLTP